MFLLVSLSSGCLPRWLPRQAEVALRFSRGVRSVHTVAKVLVLGSVQDPTLVLFSHLPREGPEGQGSLHACPEGCGA